MSLDEVHNVRWKFRHRMVKDSSYDLQDMRTLLILSHPLVV